MIHYNNRDTEHQSNKHNTNINIASAIAGDRNSRNQIEELLDLTSICNDLTISQIIKQNFEAQYKKFKIHEHCTISPESISDAHWNKSVLDAIFENRHNRADIIKQMLANGQYIYILPDFEFVNRLAMKSLDYTTFSDALNKCPEITNQKYILQKDDCNLSMYDLTKLQIKLLIRDDKINPYTNLINKSQHFAILLSFAGALLNELAKEYPVLSNSDIKSEILNKHIANNINDPWDIFKNKIIEIARLVYDYRKPHELLFTTEQDFHLTFQRFYRSSNPSKEIDKFFKQKEELLRTELSHKLKDELLAVINNNEKNKLEQARRAWRLDSFVALNEEEKEVIANKLTKLIKKLAKTDDYETYKKNLNFQKENIIKEIQRGVRYSDIITKL
jgi:hypothetical protein